MPTKPVIDYLKCNHCGVCISVCPMKVYEKEDDKVIVKRPSECIGCRACEVQCPENAIGIIDLKEEKRADEELKEELKEQTEELKEQKEKIKELEKDIKETEDKDEKKELKEELKEEKEKIKELEKEIKEEENKESEKE